MEANRPQADGAPYKGLKTLSLILVVIITLLSGHYLVTYPENANPYFSTYNPYLGYVQSSMLQNTVPIKDAQATVEVIRWLDTNFDDESVLIVHEAFYNWAAIYFHHRDSLILIGEKDQSQLHHQTILQQVISTSTNASEKGCKAYTIWWNNGRGWYGIPQLPPEFTEVKASADMAAYLFIFVK